MALRSILSPGDEVLVIAPYFVEYFFYIRNAGGVPVVAEASETFQLDVRAIRDRITSYNVCYTKLLRFEIFFFK